ncbi:hypothetical protein [Leptolyngbya ohadii]|uniref:hypothetical protein n=1 Tax=Leptolyngbya ohadii TaxID=1962290 RepID=UPI0019D4E6A2|nr:hypothetical protein [Leptolyngbya ohadii]
MIRLSSVLGLFAVEFIPSIALLFSIGESLEAMPENTHVALSEGFGCILQKLLDFAVLVNGIAPLVQQSKFTASAPLYCSLFYPSLPDE